MTIAKIDPTSLEQVQANVDTTFTWDYERSRPALGKLYEKAKTSQWNASTDLDWSIDVDQEAVVLANAGADGGFFSQEIDLSGTPFAKWGDKEWVQRYLTKDGDAHEKMTLANLILSGGIREEKAA